MVRVLASALALSLTLLLLPAARAQETPTGPLLPEADSGGGQAGDDVQSPIVVLNQERLLSQSLYGQRIQREVEAAGTALATENRAIEARLTEEELALTERRATMTPEAFRPVAEEFDTRVNAIRAAQEAKGRALQQQAEAAQQQFFEIAFPVLIELLRARGAAVLMDNRAVLLSAEGVDITDAAIALIDARIGEGDQAPLIDLDGTAQDRPLAPGEGLAPAPAP
jgi:Skp family chaperone for outer membrane proteins